jgi:integrase
MLRCEPVGRSWQRGWIEVKGPRGNKRYVGRYRLNGKQVPIVLGFVEEMTLTEARGKLEAHVRSLGSRPQQRASTTFNEYWQQHYVPNHKLAWSEPTTAGYEAYRRAYLSPAFGSVLLTDITPALITAFFEQLRKTRSRDVVRKCWTLLKSVLEDAAADERLIKNPMRKVTPPKTTEPKRPTLDNKTLARVLKAVEDRPLENAVLHVGAFCAIRTAELFGLRWQSWKGDSFHITDSAWRGRLLTDETKTGARRVFIPPATRRALRNWHKHATFTASNDILFATKAGSPVSAHNFHNRVLRPLRNKLKLSVPLTFQVLRRSHATRNQGTPKAAQSHLGHRNITTTLNIYAQEVPASVKAMVTADESKILSKRKSFAPKLLPHQNFDNGVSS